MTSDEALVAIRRGKKVARSKWRRGAFLDTDRCGNIAYHFAWNPGITMLFALEQEDEDATDWYVCEGLHD